MRKIQSSIERSRPEEACHHGISHGAAGVVFSVFAVLVVVKADAIRLPTNRIRPHQRTRLFSCTDDDASGGRRACVRAPGCRQHQHIFTFHRDAFDYQAESGMCMPSRSLNITGY
ncbi:hypothetical protein [Candidatus Binatus sp.]|uniref:hypothetical protein n=1 Tax=Candidatus Binatus sp. TaxID=2811406 RepID=UPI003F9ACB30